MRQKSGPIHLPFHYESESKKYLQIFIYNRFRADGTILLMEHAVRHVPPNFGPCCVVLTNREEASVTKGRFCKRVVLANVL